MNTCKDVFEKNHFVLFHKTLENQTSSPAPTGLCTKKGVTVIAFCVITDIIFCVAMQKLFQVIFKEQNKIKYSKQSEL